MKIKLTTFKIHHKYKVVSTIDAILTIVGGFHDLSCVTFFRVTNQKYQKMENRPLWFITRKKLNRVNRENHQQSLKQRQSLKRLYFFGVF